MSPIFLCSDGFYFNVPLYRADQNTVIHRAIPRGISDALLAATQVIGPPHAEKGSLLVDAAELFVSDLPNASRYLQALQREGIASYQLDERSSYLRQVKSFPDNNELEVLLNYQGEGTDFPTPTLADDRSFRHLIRYSLGALPETSYRPRAADDRVGPFHHHVLGS